MEERQGAQQDAPCSEISVGRHLDRYRNLARTGKDMAKLDLETRSAVRHQVMDMCGCAQTENQDAVFFDVFDPALLPRFHRKYLPIGKQQMRVDVSTPRSRIHAFWFLVPASLIGRSSPWDLPT